MKRLHIAGVAVLVLAICAGAGHAAFIVEPHSTGTGFANFVGTPRYTATHSTAVGLTGSQSAYGSTVGAAAAHIYTMSYTPGVDADNTVLAAGTVLGEQKLVDAGGGAFNTVSEQLVASGLTGGGTGLYNVYITFPASTNVNASGSSITVTHDGGSNVWNPVNNNTNGTGTPGGNNAWLLIAESVQLTAGQTYSVAMQANSTAFVSQRLSGVMWEALPAPPPPVPEPMSMTLVGVGLAAIARFRRR